MNKVCQTGRITRDLELKEFGGTACCKFSIAVDRKFKKEGQPTCDFLNCIAWGKIAELICQYLKKGSKIGISGRLQSGSYDNADGKKVYTTDIVVEEMDFLDSKKDSQGDSYESKPVEQKQGDGFYPVSEETDELPF